MQERQTRQERRAPNWAVYLVMGLGVSGTGFGVIRTQGAEQSASVSQREADKAIAQRNRFEDQMNHCLERQIDFLREQPHAR